MINVNGTTNVARAISQNPRIRVTHEELPAGVGLQVRAHLEGNESEIRSVTSNTTSTVFHASATGEEGERIVLIVEATGTGSISVSEVISGAGPEDLV